MSDTRLFLSTHENPRIAWNQVEGAKSYLLKMSRKSDAKILWEFESKNHEVVEYPENSGNFFCVIDYPTPSNLYPLLKPNEAYVITGETKNEKYFFDAEAEIRLLDNSTLDAIEKLRVAMESAGNSDVTEKFGDVIEQVLFPLKGKVAAAGPPKWYPKPYCFSLNFV